MPDLTSLIERVEGGVGPDRELDLAVCLAIGRLSEDENGHIFYIDEHGSKVFGGHGWEIITPELTGSLDRVVSLIEAKLPGWRVENLAEWDHEVLRERGPWMAQLQRRGVVGNGPMAIDCRNASSPARALLAATLKALQESRNADR